MKAYNKWLVLVLLFASVLAGNFTAHASTIVVTPSDLNGWTVTNLGTTGTSDFVNGPGSPPIGSGSWESTTTAPAGFSGNRILNNSYGDTLLSEITEFSYSERHEGQPDTATYSPPYVRIWISLPGIGNERFTFEPFFQQVDGSGNMQIGGKTQRNAYSVWGNQNGITTAGVPDNTWYKWDLLNGAWYADGNYISMPDNQLVTIAGLISEFGTDVKMVSGGANQGFFHGQDGFNGYYDWKGYIDGFSLTTKTSGNTLWDFEPISVPEPATMLLFGAGLTGLGIMRKRFKV